MKKIQPYFDNPPADDDPVWDSVDVMVTIIEDYERRHFPLIDNATALDSVLFSMDQKGLIPKDLVPGIGRPDPILFEGDRSFSTL